MNTKKEIDQYLHILFADEKDIKRWWHSFNDGLGGIPKKLIEEGEGERVAHYLRGYLL